VNRWEMTGVGVGVVDQPGIRPGYGDQSAAG